MHRRRHGRHLAVLARTVTAVMLLSMASPLAVAAPVGAIADNVRRQLDVLLGRPPKA